MATIVATGVVTVWYVWPMWVLQDIQGVLVCWASLVWFRLPNMRVALVVSGVVILYAITSVLAGAPSLDALAQDSPKAALYCLEGLRCPWTQGLRAPRTSLGAIDLILPGMILTYARKMERPLEGRYFAVQCVAYAFGIAAALCVALALGVGQPAMVYVLPTMWCAMYVQASQADDWDVLWEGYSSSMPIND